MPEIRAELVHFAIRVATCSIPIQDRFHGHRVSQIMKAGTVAEPTRCLPFTKTDLMADLREVVPTIDCGQAPAAFVFLITTQAKRNLSSRSGIGGVRSAT